jgi:hypothetical protein
MQVLASCEYAQQLMEKEQLYGQLFQLVNSCGPPDYLTLQERVVHQNHFILLRINFRVFFKKPDHCINIK